MKLKEKINADLIAAMKANEEVKLGALRMLKAAIMKFEVAGDKRIDASDENVLQIIGKEVKQHRDSIEAYKKGGREDLAKKEEAEMLVLQAYLPAQMSEDELRGVISRTISQLNAAKTDMGKVMGAVMKEVKGKADGQMVKRLVEEMLK